MQPDEPAQTETIDFIEEREYPAEAGRYELILTKTNKFYVVDIRTITESITAPNE